MCVIIHLPEGEIFEEEAWINAVNNNENGFGMLVLRDKPKRKTKEIELIKKFSDDGLDPEDLYQIMCDHSDHERWIHLRYTTVGETSMDNVQPFKVFEDKHTSRQAFFMHNGTLSQFRGESGYVHGYQTFPQTKSDTMRFADEVVAPLLEVIQTKDGGKGDYNCKFAEEYLDDIWKKQGTAKNRGVIVSNFAPPLLLNLDLWSRYTQYDQEDDHLRDILVSNDDYFDELVRGSLFEENKKKDEEERKKNAEAVFGRNGGEKRPVTPLIDFRAHLDHVSTLPSMDRIFDDPDLFNDGTLNDRYLAGVTYNEWMELCDHQGSEELSAIFMALSDAYWKSSTQLLTANAKIKKLETQLEEVHQTERVG